METELHPQLSERTAGGGSVERMERVTRLHIPAGTAGVYRLAQLDDTHGLPRRKFAHTGEFEMRIRARASERDLPGTWGFGVWNEPFGFGVGKGVGLRLPTLPNAAWFFHASRRNHLSLRDDLPGNGLLVQVFRSPPGEVFYPLAPGLALLAWPAAARLIRRIGRAVVREAGARVEIDETAWRTFDLRIDSDGTRMAVDGAPVLETRLTPRGRLGMAVWVDNQFAAFGPDGKIQAGLEEHPRPAWIEIDWAG